MRLFYLVIVSVTICAAGALGQTGTVGGNGTSGFRGSASFGPPPPAGMRAQTGAPYSGDQVTEQTQTLADGTHITQKSASTKVYRDSAGRTRTERPMFRALIAAGKMPDSPTVIEITDPVAQIKYTLDTVNKVAHRQRFPAFVPRAVPGSRGGGGSVQAVLTQTAPAGGGTGVVTPVIGSTVSVASAPQPRVEPQMTNEKLGTQTIEGVLANGTRHTTTWPVDSQGNDRPISVISETWTGVDLKVMILSKTTDPRSGEHTQKLTNISQSEPDPNLFQPPADYTVVDESDNFTIKWGQQN